MSLRDSLAADVTVGYDYAFANGLPCDGPIADSILRSPEMQGIQKALQRVAREDRSGLPRHEALAVLGLHENVINWVLRGS